tara:strand:- start:660 stop:1094 length:435 start_codon:yes stop_codon:yes gene_type:complete
MTLSIAGMEIVFNFWTLAFLFTSIFVVFLLLYVKYLIEQLAEISEIFIKINNEAISFASHLKSINELEMFYGDEVLGGLMKHSLYLVDRFEEFGEVADITEPIDEEELNESEENDINDSEEDNPAQTLPYQPELFYGGPRQSDS